MRFPTNHSVKDKSHEKLLPPLVSDLREKVFSWRAKGYPEISETSKNLLQW